MSQCLEIKSSRAKYDRRDRCLCFESEQKVWLFNPRTLEKTPKLQSNWERPYQVVKRINDVVYCIRKSSRYKNKVVWID